MVKLLRWTRIRPGVGVRTREVERKSVGTSTVTTMTQLSRPSLTEEAPGASPDPHSHPHPHPQCFCTCSCCPTAPTTRRPQGPLHSDLCSNFTLLLKPFSTTLYKIETPFPPCLSIPWPPILLYFLPHILGPSNIFYTSLFICTSFPLSSRVVTFSVTELSTWFVFTKCVLNEKNKNLVSVWV